MINLKQKMLIHNGGIEAIKEFQVWWISISGLCTTLDEAIQDAEKHGADASILRPVSVAIGTNGYYEVIMR